MLTPFIILLLLCAPLGIEMARARRAGKSARTRRFACFGLALAFFFFALGHVVQAAGMVEMLPPWIPGRLMLVYLTGLLELMVGVALLRAQSQVLAAKIAIVIFVVFFPVNIYSALNGIGLGGHQWGPIYLLIRAPLQLILIAWAYFLCVKGDFIDPGQAR